MRSGAGWVSVRMATTLSRERVGVDRAALTGVSRREWLTLASAFLGWLFDCLDLSLFTFVFVPCLQDLLQSSDPGRIAWIGGLVLAAKLFCWGVGGVVFGVLADRLGRVRIMGITIAIYAGFTGLSALARTWQELAVWQALAGFGIGGEWAAGAALVAETWPERYRARAMQVLQMAFAVGFFLAAIDNLLLGPIGWRLVLAAGVAPGLLSLVILRFVPEPERWRLARDRDDGARPAAATLSAIFAPDLRRRTIVGTAVATAMMIGSWGGITLLPNWIQQLVRTSGANGATGVRMVSYAFMIMMVGATAGYITLIWLTQAVGRRVSYFVFCAGALAASLYLFTSIATLDALLWFMPLYGYFAIGGFGTFALYLPEIFPTRVRATGQGFCWNAARSVTAIGPLTVGLLVATFNSYPAAALTTTVAYLIGLVAIWFGPETMGRPLPE